MSYENLSLPAAGSGVRVDNVGGGSHVQAMKLLSGVAGSTDPIGGDSTNGMDVDVTRLPKSATAALSNVNASVSDVSLLASNANRLGATFYNDSPAVCYLKLGTGAASSTSFTVKLEQDDYYEVPANFTGEVRGIWTAATGAMRVTELT